MPEVNTPSCLTHGSIPRSLHSENFEGIVTVIEALINTVSGVGTISYSRCPYGYPYNFEGVVRALEDLNTTVSGISTSATAVLSGIVAGSGIYITPSGGSSIINVGAAGQGSVSVSYSGSFLTISGAQSTTTVVSGSPGTGYEAGTLWFDTNEGRLFVYASGNGVSSPDWYQTNAEPIVLKGETPPSGTGLNSPPRDGSIWFNTLIGNLFVYDATTSGWYETAPTRSVAYGPAAPVADVEGAGWLDSSVSKLKIWNGSIWAEV
jgi:hypothetical protein